MNWTFSQGFHAFLPLRIIRHTRLFTSHPFDAHSCSLCTSSANPFTASYDVLHRASRSQSRLSLKTCIEHGGQSVVFPSEFCASSTNRIYYLLFWCCATYLSDAPLLCLTHVSTCSRALCFVHLMLALQLGAS